jgi:hypothetical protein
VIVSLNPRQCHPGGGFARKRRITPHFIFDQAIRLLVIPQTGRQQSRLDSRASNNGANDPSDQNHAGANPQKMRPTQHSYSPCAPDYIHQTLYPAVMGEGRIGAHLRKGSSGRVPEVHFVNPREV